MTYFYRTMIWLTEFELAIARSTGRNHDNIEQLQRDLSGWELDLFKVQMESKS